MSGSQSTSTEPQAYVPWYVLRPGVRRCEHILKELRKFQSLIRHCDRRATDVDLAEPLSTVIPNLNSNGNWWDTHQQIEAEIQRRMLPVHQYLCLIGVGTQWTLHDREGCGWTRDIIRDYFRFPEEM